MKSLKNILSICVILAFYACGDRSDKPDTDSPDTPIPAPEIVISVEQASNLFNNYGENRRRLIEEFENQDLGEGETPFLATSSITFDFETLKTYMAYVEQQADSAKADIKGLRVYFGQYDDAPAAKYPSAETVFMNPTMLLPSGDEVSFAIQTKGDDSMAVPVGNILNNDKPAGKANLTLKVQETTSLAANQGSRRPPPMNDENDY